MHIQKKIPHQCGSNYIGLLIVIESKDKENLGICVFITKKEQICLSHKKIQKSLVKDGQFPNTAMGKKIH